MAKKNSAKSLPLAVAIIIAVLTIAVIGVFLIYLLAPNNLSDESSVGDVSYDQSYGGESSLEPPPEEIVIKETMADAAVGDAVIFGSYEQNGNSSDGAEKIEWIVLEKQEDKILLISRYCLDSKPINETRTDVDWNNSTLCNWLNNEFKNSVFSEEEVASLIETDGISINIPSVEDATKYYQYDSWRAGDATVHAVNSGARVQNGKCWWWLLDKGEIANSNSYVYFNGTIRTNGLSVDYSSVAIRPMIWVASDAETETEHLSQAESEIETESSEESGNETESENESEISE